MSNNLNNNNTTNILNNNYTTNILNNNMSNVLNNNNTTNILNNNNTTNILNNITTNKIINNTMNILNNNTTNILNNNTTNNLKYYPIDCSFANPVFISQLLQHYYSKLVNNKKLWKKLSYNILDNNNFDDLLRLFLKHNNRAIPDNVILRACNAGSSFAIIAFYYSIWQIKQRQITVSSAIEPPYYVLHKEIALSTGFCTWIDDGSYTDVVVCVSPNNPNGIITKISPENKGEYILLDAIYDYYNFTGDKNSVNDWIVWNDKFCQITSISKMGMAGSRIAGIMSSNPVIIGYAQNYFSNVALGTNTFCIETLKCIIGKIRLESRFTKQVYKILQKRLKIIKKVIPHDLIFSNNNVPFLFVKIGFEFFNNINVKIREGSQFEVSDEYSRIELMIDNKDFKALIKRLKEYY